MTVHRPDPEGMFCEWAASLTYADLPPNSVAKVRELVADTIGCGIGGLSSRAASVARALSTPTAHGGVSVIGLADRYPVAEAARHMSIACHVLEMDDIVPTGSVHPGAVVIPAALAVGDLLDATGEQLVVAIVVGYELMVRLAEAVEPARHYEDGFHPTATCGVFGAAAAAASLLGVGPASFRTSLGTASTAVAGTLSYLNDGAATKPIQVGNAAAAGTFAALTDHAGVTGPTTVFGGRYGFFHAYAPKADATAVARSLGDEPLRVEQSGIKPYACCRYVQPGVGLIIDTCEAHDVTAEQIEEIRIGVVAPATQIVGEPRHRKVSPTTSVDVQFSLPFSAAIAVQKRQLMPSDVAEGLGNVELSRLAERIQLVHDPQLDEAYPAKWGGWVEIDRIDGADTLTAATEEPKGDPANPLSGPELQRKLRALAGDRYSTTIERAAGQIAAGSVRGFIETIEERR